MQGTDERKEAGTLDTVDEKSSQIHPKDRVNLGTSLPSKRDRMSRRIIRNVPSRAAKRGAPIVLDSSDDEADDSEGDYNSHDDADADENEIESKRGKAPGPTRRSTRTATVDNKIRYRDTPLSPAKTRATPKRHTLRTAGDDGYIHDDEDDEDEDSGENVKEKPIRKKAVRGRLSRPAYGNIRPVADLSDDDSDDETAPLRAHVKRCEKCQKAPAHELLTKLYTRGKKIKARKKSEQGDDFEDDENEEQKYLRLGGWVRWCV